MKTIVDPACMDIGRDVRLAKRVVEADRHQARDVHRHLRRALHVPPAPLPEPRGRLARRRVRPRHRAGDPGNRGQGSVPQVRGRRAGDHASDVEKILRACARASKRTGRPIMAHSHPATRRGLEIMDVFDEEGVDPKLVQIAHTGDTDDLDYIEELLARALHRHGPLRPGHHPADRAAQRDRGRAQQARLCASG